MKKTMVLLAMTVLGFAFFYQNASHADTSQGVKTTQNQKLLSSKMDSTSIPWGNTGLNVTFDTDGTLHLPSGNVTNPPALYTLFGGPESPTLKEVKKIVLDGPLFIYGSAKGLFSELSKVSEFSGFNNLNTVNVTNMSNMFTNMVSIPNLDVSQLDTQNVTNMSQMFWGVGFVTNLNLDNFNTENVTNMSGMFSI